MKFCNPFTLKLEQITSAGRHVALLVAATLVLLTGCSTQPSQPAVPDTENKSTEQVIPKSLTTGYKKALEQLRGNQTEQAFQSFSKLAELYPSYSGPYINLGLIYLKRNETDMAEQLFKQAISVNPDSFSGHHQLAILYRKKGLFAEAEIHYLKARKIDPSNPDVHRNLAILYDLYMGKLPEALALYQTYQGLLPEPDPALKGWIIDIQNRINTQSTATEN